MAGTSLPKESVKKMPRFYFHLWNGVQAQDEEGMELEDFDAARAEARSGAAEVIAEHIRDGERIDLGHRIEIEDQHGRVVCTLCFRDLVDIDS